MYHDHEDILPEVNFFYKNNNFNDNKLNLSKDIIEKKERWRHLTRFVNSFVVLFSRKYPSVAYDRLFTLLISTGWKKKMAGSPTDEKQVDLNKGMDIFQLISYW